MTGVALALVLLSALMHVAWNTAMRGSGTPTAFLLAMEWLSLLLLAPLIALLPFAEISGRVWAIGVVSGAVHAAYGYWLSRAYAWGELSLVYPIARSTPALLPLFAVPLLGEEITPAAGLGVALVVVGMWAVQTDGRLDAAALRSRGALLAYLTLLGTVAYSLVDKLGMQWIDSDPWAGPLPHSVGFFLLMYAFYLPLFTALCLRSSGIAEVARTLRARRWQIAGAAVVAQASYVLILEAMRTAAVSHVVAVRQSSVLFAVAFAVLWLRERPGPVRMAGALANVTGVALIALGG